jgi:hypothetical protein
MLRSSRRARIGVFDVEAEVVDVAAENVDPVEELADLFGWKLVVDVLQVVLVGLWVLHGRCVQFWCGAGRCVEFPHGGLDGLLDGRPAGTRFDRAVVDGEHRVLAERVVDDGERA